MSEASPRDAYLLRGDQPHDEPVASSRGARLPTAGRTAAPAPGPALGPSVAVRRHLQRAGRPRVRRALAGVEHHAAALRLRRHLLAGVAALVARLRPVVRPQPVLLELRRLPGRHQPDEQHGRTAARVPPRPGHPDPRTGVGVQPRHAPRLRPVSAVDVPRATALDEVVAGGLHRRASLRLQSLHGGTGAIPQLPALRAPPADHHRAARRDPPPPPAPGAQRDHPRRGGHGAAPDLRRGAPDGRPARRLRPRRAGPAAPGGGRRAGGGHRPRARGGRAHRRGPGRLPAVDVLPGAVPHLRAAPPDLAAGVVLQLRGRAHLSHADSSASRSATGW